MVSQSAKLPISMCHHVPMLPTVCQERLLNDSPCTHVSHHLWPSCAHRLYPYCPSVVPIVCKVPMSISLECVHRVPKFPKPTRPSCAKDAHIKVALQTKLPISVYLSCAKIAHYMVPLLTKLSTFMLTLCAKVSNQMVPLLPM